MTKLTPALLSAVLLVTTGWTLSCKPEAAAPPAQASPTAPGVQYTFGTGSMATAAPGTQGTAATGEKRGLGCDNSPDAEVVPDEPGLRECCTKLGWGDACMGSVCWAAGVIAKVKTQMVAGGKCAQ